MSRGYRENIHFAELCFNSDSDSFLYQNMHISVFPQLGLKLGASKRGESEVAQSEVHRKSTRPALLCAPDFSPLGYTSKKWSQVEIHSTFFDNHSSQKP